MIIVGLDANGSAQTELVTLSSGTITGSSIWTYISHIAAVLGEHTEYYVIEGGASPNADDVLGHVVSPSDAQGTEVELFFK